MDESGSPTSRALRTLEAMQLHPGISAAELARRLDVTERAARRYVAILREAGIVVESTPGRHGGYRLGRGSRLPPLVFTGAEALGLVMAVLDGQHAAADTDDPVGAGLAKLIRALPEAVGRQAALMREHAVSTPPSTATRPDPEVASRLVDAVARTRRVELGYRTAAGISTRPVVEPWAVVVRGGRWYLLCRVPDRDVVRAYRVDRVDEAVLRPETFTPPADLDPVAMLGHHLGADRAFATRVRFAAPIEAVAPFVSATMGRLDPTPDGGCLLIGSTSNPAGYAAEGLAPIGVPMTVEGGPELRAAMADLADRLTATLR